MEKWWIWVLFGGALLLGSLISSVVSANFFRNAAKNEDGAPAAGRKKAAAEPETPWEKEGRRGSFESSGYELPEDDFFENEKTELPEDFEELFSGISEEEAGELLCEADLLSEKPEEKDGRQ